MSGVSQGELAGLVTVLLQGQGGNTGEGILLCIVQEDLSQLEQTGPISLDGYVTFDVRTKLQTLFEEQRLEAEDGIL